MWTRLSPICHIHFPKLIGINSNQFIVVPSTYPIPGIQIYDISKDEWIESNLIEYNTNHSISGHTTALNKKTNILYIHNPFESNLIQINLNNKKWDITANLYDIGYGAKSIIINNEFHVIGGHQSNKHHIWNEKQKEYKQIHEFINFTSGGPMDHGLIYIESRNILLLFGGQKATSCRNSDKIYSYYTITNKWSELNIKSLEGASNFGIISVDDRYVIIFGGETIYSYYSNTISIFDLELNKIYKSNVKCPIKGMFKAILCDLTLLLGYGYIRNLKIQLVPNDIINLICSMAATRYVHLIEYGGYGKHWKISLDEILKT